MELREDEDLLFFYFKIAVDTYTFTWMSKKLLAYIFKNYLMSQSIQETFKKKNSI